MRKRLILILTGLVAAVACGAVGIFTLYPALNPFRDRTPPLQEGLRAFPYPYTSMLALQSHIDGTTPEEYETVHHFLNDGENTIYGDGLRLDVGDSLWLYNDNNGDSYRSWETALENGDYMTWFEGVSGEENAADLIREGVAKGWIDSIHSYGDFSRVDTDDVTFTRELAERAIRTLTDNDIRLKVWINHGNEANRQNFGGWLPFTATGYQAGDDPASAWYHTDLLIDYGIRYLWNSRNSADLGEDDPLYLIELRDGQKLWGFNAFTGVQEGLRFRYTWTPRDICQVLTDENLSALADSRQFAIIATHFGSGSLWEVMGEHNLPAFRLLRDYQKAGKILVARSERLLDYAAVRRCVEFTIDGNAVNIQGVNDPTSVYYVPTPEYLYGLTFYVADSDTATVSIAGVPVDESLLVRNPADETGRESIGFTWYSDAAQAAPHSPGGQTPKR